MLDVFLPITMSYFPFTYKIDVDKFLLSDTICDLFKISICQRVSSTFSGMTSCNSQRFQVEVRTASGSAKEGEEFRAPRMMGRCFVGTLGVQWGCKWNMVI